MIKHKKLIASAAFAMATMTPAYVATEEATASNVSFYDVQPSDYFAEAVYALAEDGIISGYQGQFAPNRDVTRGEAVKMLYGIINPNGFEPVNTPTFVDVDASHMFYKQIAYLSDLKIINGTGGAQPRFNPDAPIKREEMAIMIQRAFELPGSDAHGPDFTDMREPYKEAIELLYVNDITRGISKTEFGSQQNVTRGQIAVFLYKADNVHNYSGHYVEGTIEAVTNSYVQIDGRKYEIPTDYETLFSADNEQALLDAKVDIIVNKQTIQSLVTLDLKGTSSKSKPLVLSGNGTEWSGLRIIVSSPYVKLDDVYVHTVIVGEDGKYVDFTGEAWQMDLSAGVNEHFTLAGSGQIRDFYQNYADEVELHFAGIIGIYDFDTSHKSLTIGDDTTIYFLQTDVEEEQLANIINGLERIETVSSSFGLDEDWEEDISEDDWYEEDDWSDDESEDGQETIVNPDFQGPYDGVISAVEDGRLKVGNQWLTITGQMNEFFNRNADMLLGTTQFMRAFKGEITSIDMLILEKSGILEATSYYDMIDVRSLRIDADNVEVNNINVSNLLYLSDKVKTSFTFKYGQSRGEFTIENEDEPTAKAVNADDLVLTFENADIANLNIYKPNRRIEMGQTVNFTNLAIEVPENAQKRYPVITMKSYRDELSFKTRLALLTGESSFIVSEMYPHSPKVGGNAIVEELSLMKGEVEWLTEGMIHSLSSYADEKITIGDNVLIGATYDRFGDKVLGQFLVKNGKLHKEQFNAKLSDKHYVIPTLVPEYLNYGEYILRLLGAEDKKVLHRLASANEWDKYEIGDKAEGAQFINRDDSIYVTYWHDKELMVYVVDDQNRILSKHLYNPVEGRDEAFEMEFMNQKVTIQSVLSENLPALDYLYYFVDGELKGVENKELLNWANDGFVNRLDIPELEENYSNIWYPFGFAYTINGEQHIQQFNDSDESDLRILPGLGKDFLVNKTEGSKLMTKYIVKKLYDGSPYEPKGLEYEFILKQYMADFSAETNLTMKRIGEIVPKHDKAETNLKHIQHIQQVRNLMNGFERRVQLMVNEGRKADALVTIEEMREKVELVREESLRVEYMEILDRLKSEL